MGAVKPQQVVCVGAIALFLYWVVQDPVGAATMIRDITGWVVEMLQLIAGRVVEFLGALA